MGISLIGLIYLQYLLLKDAAELKEQAFRQNVTAAMHAIAQKLQTHEAVENVFRYRNLVSSGTDPDGRKKITLRIDANAGGGQMKIATLDGGPPKMHFITAAAPIRLEGNTIRYSVTEPQHVTLRLFNSFGKEDTVLVDTFQQVGDYSLLVDKTRFSGNGFYCKFGTDNSSFVTHMSYDGGNNGGGRVISSFTSTEERRAMVGNVLDNLTITEDQPVERRIDPSLLDSLVHNSLRESGIALPCAYGVLSQRTDSLRFVRASTGSQVGTQDGTQNSAQGEQAGLLQQIRGTEFRAALFPFDFLANNTLLLLYFPDEKLFLWKAIGPMLALTILFMSVIIVCFATTLRMIVRQQQFSGRLTDFINNMTHEFKTPVSTIAVAAETMMRPEILEQPERLMRYGTVIHDENQRMKSHIDRILQMAVLEEGEYELKKAPVDVHEILTQAVEPLRLRVESREGTIRCDFRAVHKMLFADPVHLTNVFHNLLDNASKYSPDKPDISIETWDSGSTLSVRISDKGIGIGKDEQKKIFEKYYRVPTGNIHNVKGFGLGLSYVKFIADAHAVLISLESEPGMGTAITLSFPLASQEDIQA